MILMSEAKIQCNLDSGGWRPKGVGFRRLEAGRQVRRHGEHKDGAAADGSGNGGDEGLASGKPGWDGNDHVSSAYSSIGQQKELEAFGIREKMQRFLRFL